MDPGVTCDVTGLVDSAPVKGGAMNSENDTFSSSGSDGGGDLALIRERLALAERNAQVGMQVRTILHELGNVIQTLELTMNPTGEIDREVVNRSLYFMKRISNIVLRDIDLRIQSEDVSVQDLVEDIQLLIRPTVLGKQYGFFMNVDSKISTKFIQERPGSVFLIVQNLVVNAMDAIRRAQQGPMQGKVAIDFNLIGEMVYITVKDNGVGLSSGDAEVLMAGDSSSLREKKRTLPSR
ncbi:MAG: hypothetical protein EBU49_05255 [Proteobacteria bacterium]|nr:hypothetical protein [Pseudomonadota bacterium]